MKKIVIAIDGYSSCGKSTLAKQLAKKLGYAYVDSGAMYRAVTHYILTNNIDIENAQAVKQALQNIKIEFVISGIDQSNETMLNGINVDEAIRGKLVSAYVSEVSALKAVRKEMVNLQRISGKKKGIVMDGRDIGTNVFPDAELKIFMTAQPEIRIERRYKELIEKGMPQTKQEVRENLEHRDIIDTTRQENPLVRAQDAYMLDNSNYTVEQQLEIVYKMALEKIGQ
jgi:CMP/dCMP kinase